MTESAPDLSSPPAQAFLRGVLESMLARTGCETGAVVLGSTVIVDPHRSLPPEWQQAITALAREPEVAYVGMRPFWTRVVPFGWCCGSGWTWAGRRW